MCPTSSISNGLFAGCDTFNEDIGGWDVSQSMNMSYMFSICRTFNQSLADWDVSQATNMIFMFKHVGMYRGSLT